MFYAPSEDKYIVEGNPFTIDDVQYPANWLNLSTPEEKAELGLEEVITVGKRKDDRYYWVSESLSGAVLTITSTPKDLEQVRTICIEGLKTASYSLLLPSDWMVVRKQETGIEIPADWTQYRNNVRLECGLRVNQAQAATSVDEMAAIAPDWPLAPNTSIQN